MSGSRPPGGVVYISGLGRVCPRCAEPVASCRCAGQRAAAAASAKPRGDGVVRLRRETQQRGGKVVTVVDGVPLVGAELETLAKTLKQRCGTGGTLRDGVIELQGDQRDKVEPLLRERGFTVKRAGG
ncbi:MAG: stress response translation initiation inhibitor YciH [Planctomycetes bacterium]|nr:stress response translation initiation inhibitor YciH [Planctomycetota bacterium]